MTKEQVKILADRYIRGEASEEETMALLKIYETYQEQVLEWDELLMGNQASVERQLYSRIINEIDARAVAAQKRPAFAMAFFGYAAAAAVLFFLSIGIYLLRKEQVRSADKSLSVHRVIPGVNQATLILANGKRITLTGALKGRLAQQNNTVIQVNDKIGLSFTSEITSSTENKEISYNTLSTRRGEQSPYPLVLADGTKVWLNAASSLKFPSIFYKAKTREVELSGEGYFEVAKDKKHPFIVKSGRQQIEVLGTHFNISSYADEQNIKTTLLEGSVKINNGLILKPGQQSIFSTMDIKVVRIDTAQVIAWLKGDFDFEGVALPIIMRQISRWYNVDVEYISPIPKIKLSGSISKSADIVDVLNSLQATQAVHFKIDGRRVSVMP